MHPLKSASFALTLGALILTACVTWTQVSFIDAVAFSDDDSEIVVVTLSYEEKRSSSPTSGTTDKRNMTHAIHLQRVDGSNRRALAEGIPGQNGAEVYYMRAAGYVLTEGVSETARWFVRTGLDGQRHEVARVSTERCEGHYFDVVPSPDGALLAEVRGAPGCVEPSASPSPTGGSQPASVGLTVRIRNASSLAILREATVSLQETGIDWTWRADGRFVLSDGSGAWAISASHAASATTLPGCLWPKTTSSEWSARGHRVFSDGERVHVDASQTGPAFGCQ